MDVTIVIPVFNQLHFTRQCLESLNAAGCNDSMIVVINNASTDGTAEFLATRPKLCVIHNPENRACSAAWNQGFEAGKTKWTVFLNNDTVVPAGWLESLLNFAEKNGVDIASPGMGEGDLDYDLSLYAHEYVASMKAVQRRGTASGVCFMVARSVFEVIGNFDENFNKGGNEDTDFFWRAQKAGIKMAVSGCTYIHHFGSVTQKALKTARGSTRAETVGYFRRKWKINWAQRRWNRIRRKTAGNWRKIFERLWHGHTLLELRVAGKIRYYYH
ncbi:MAG TPA: glycosyltransferase family 2 protein [Verrucomicrobiae bacterium]